VIRVACPEKRGAIGSRRCATTPNAKADDPIRITEYLKPARRKICALLAGRALAQHLARLAAPAGGL